VLVGKAVHLLNDLDTLVPILVNLGKKHAPRGVVADHFPIVGQALLQTLEGGLGKIFTEEVRQSWTIAFQILSDTIISGINEDKPKEFPV
jgi:nitric oxide dioxygenase